MRTVLVHLACVSVLARKASERLLISPSNEQDSSPISCPPVQLHHHETDGLLWNRAQHPQVIHECMESANVMLPFVHSLFYVVSNPRVEGVVNLCWSHWDALSASCVLLPSRMHNMWLLVCIPFAVVLTQQGSTKLWLL